MDTKTKTCSICEEKFAGKRRGRVYYCEDCRLYVQKNPQDYQHWRIYGKPNKNIKSHVTKLKRRRYNASKTSSGEKSKLSEVSCETVKAHPHENRVSTDNITTELDAKIGSTSTPSDETLLNIEKKYDVRICGPNSTIFQESFSENENGNSNCDAASSLSSTLPPSPMILFPFRTSKVCSSDLEIVHDYHDIEGIIPVPLSQIGKFNTDLDNYDPVLSHCLSDDTDVM